MAISKKGKRKIVIDDQVFYWKFNSKVFVYSEENKNQVLIVDFGYFDIWLYVNDKENRPPEFEPKSVTPKFVSESIQYALKNGWKDGKMEIEFKEGKYIKSQTN